MRDAATFDKTQESGASVPSMHRESFLAQAFIYLLAAVVSVPIAKRLGLGSVLGYLLAGVVIGPAALGFVGHEGHVSLRAKGLI